MSEDHISADDLFHPGYPVKHAGNLSFSVSARQYAFPVCALCVRYEGTLDMKIHGQRYVACRLSAGRAVRARMCSGRGGGKVSCAFYLPRTREIDGHAIIRKK